MQYSTSPSHCTQVHIYMYTLNINKLSGRGSPFLFRPAVIFVMNDRGLMYTYDTDYDH